MPFKRKVDILFSHLVSQKLSYRVDHHKRRADKHYLRILPYIGDILDKTHHKSSAPHPGIIFIVVHRNYDIASSLPTIELFAKKDKTRRFKPGQDIQFF